MKIKSDYSNYLFFLGATIVIMLQFLIIRYDILLKFDANLNFINYIARSIADTLLLLLPFWIIPVRFRHLIWLIIILFTCWGISQMWYFRTYNDLMPFSSYLLFNNISPLLFNSIIGSIRFIDFFLVIPVVILFILYYHYLRLPMQRFKIRRKEKVICISSILLISSIVYIGHAFIYYQHEKGRIVSSFWGRYTSSTGNAFYFDYNGFVPLCIYSIVEAILEKQELTQTEKEQINRYICSKQQKLASLYNTPEKKNLILIIVESLNSWVLDFKINGIEVTPNLNKYCKAENSLTALRIFPQVKDGRSSDAHFMYNTGLLPIKYGAVAVRYGKANYPSMAKALKGYHSLEIVCDDAKFWNQNNTFVSYGFNEIFDCHTISHNSGEKVSDQAMFTKAFEVLKNTPQPFYAQLVTITMHQPYNELVVPMTNISCSSQYTKEIRNYLEATHFCDAAIGEFIHKLKEARIYQNSVIAIIADHNELNKNVLDGRDEVKTSDKEIPMIILNAPQTLQYKEVLGQIDVYPTLLDVMNINTYSWPGLGYSILRKPTPTSAVSWYGELAGDGGRSEIISRQKEAWNISNTMITKHFFK